jgi:bacillolysin
MKTHSIYRPVLFLLLMGISVMSMAQGAFDVKKKSSITVGTSSLNAVRIDASHTSAKSTYSVLTANTQLKSTLSRDSFAPLQPVPKNCKKIIYSSETSLPVFIQTAPENSSKTKSTSLQISSLCFSYLNELKSVLKVDYPENQFAIKNIITDRFSKTHIRLNQVYKGIPVYGAEVMVHLNKQGAGELFNGRYVTISNEIDTVPGISSATAIEKATLHLNKGKEKPLRVPAFGLIADYEKPEATLLIYRKKELLTTFVLAYNVELFAEDHHRWEYFIDASNGNVIRFFENTCHVDGAKTATALDLNNVSRNINTYQIGSTYYLLDASKPMYDPAKSQLPDKSQGAILTIDMNYTYGDNQSFQHVVSNNNSWNNPTAVSAHYNAGVAYEYYRQTFSRNSIDGKGSTIISIINVPDAETGGALDNAFWNGRFMCYGNGDVSYKPLAGGLDVAGHEMTHGVVENTAGLEYDGESGAINESIADIFGAMMDDEDWLIGEDVVLIQAFPSGALRSFSDPHNGGSSLSDRGYQPRNMDEKYTGEEDNHGVHINSGITNYAFYKFAQAVGKEQAANIYYKALTDYLTKSSQFIDLRMAVIQAATDIHGAGSDQVTQAGLAFDAVGITDGQGTDVNPTLPANPGSEYFLIYNTDLGDPKTLYRSNIAIDDVQAISTTTLLSRPSITDDGVVAVFVAGDNTLHAIYTLPGTDPQETTLPFGEIWSNAVVSKDGNRLAAVTIYADDPYIYVYDFEMDSLVSFALYNPTYTEGIEATGPLYADALEFDYTGEFLVYDAFNRLDNSDGQNIEYWDVNFIRVWDKSSNNFGDGTVFKLFSSIPENVSIGDPSFSKNSPNIIAFDYIDAGTSAYSILGCNIETNEVKTIVENNTIGWPSYNKDDSRLAFTTMNVNDDYQGEYVTLFDDKISSDGTTTPLFDKAKWPVYFATGTRNITGQKDPVLYSGGQTITVYPNPFTDNLSVQIPGDLSGKGVFEVLNHMGQIVYSGNYNSSGKETVSIPLGELSPGYYILRLRNENRIAACKIIKQ